MPWSFNWSLSFWLSHQNLVNLTVNKKVYRIFHVISSITICCCKTVKLCSLLLCFLWTMYICNGFYTGVWTYYEHCLWLQGQLCECELWTFNKSPFWSLLHTLNRVFAYAWGKYFEKQLNSCFQVILSGFHKILPQSVCHRSLCGRILWKPLRILMQNMGGLTYTRLYLSYLNQIGTL
jgi:hypothetical protein